MTYETALEGVNLIRELLSVVKMQPRSHIIYVDSAEALRIPKVQNSEGRFVAAIRGEGIRKIKYMLETQVGLKPNVFDSDYVLIHMSEQCLRLVITLGSNYLRGGFRGMLAYNYDVASARSKCYRFSDGEFFERKFDREECVFEYIWQYCISIVVLQRTSNNERYDILRNRLRTL